MKITTVSLSRTIPTGPYMNDKVGMEASLESGESESDVLHLLSARIEKWHKEANPNLYPPESMREVREGNSIPYVPLANAGQSPSKFNMPSVAPPFEINLQHERLEIEIDNCMSVDELKQWRTYHQLLPAKVNDHYNLKMKELTNG